MVVVFGGTLLALDKVGVMDYMVGVVQNLDQGDIGLEDCFGSNSYKSS